MIDMERVAGIFERLACIMWPDDAAAITHGIFLAYNPPAQNAPKHAYITVAPSQTVKGRWSAQVKMTHQGITHAYHPFLPAAVLHDFGHNLGDDILRQRLAPYLNNKDKAALDRFLSATAMRNPRYYVPG